MKNILSIFTITFITAVAFTSCKKGDIINTTTTRDTTLVNDSLRIQDTIRIKDTTRITDTIPHISTFIGFYVGKIANSTDYPTFQIDFLFRSDGTVRAYNNNSTTPGYFDTSAIPPAEGTYILSGDTVTTYCIYISDTTQKFSTIAIINSDSTYMAGSWGYGTINNGAGSFYVYKQF
jgi:hypothetical protein